MNGFHSIAETDSNLCKDWIRTGPLDHVTAIDENGKRFRGVVGDDNSLESVLLNKINSSKSVRHSAVFI